MTDLQAPICRSVSRATKPTTHVTVEVRDDYFTVFLALRWLRFFSVKLMRFSTKSIRDYRHVERWDVLSDANVSSSSGLIPHTKFWGLCRHGTCLYDSCRARHGIPLTPIEIPSWPSYFHGMSSDSPRFTAKVCTALVSRARGGVPSVARCIVSFAKIGTGCS